MTSLLVHRMYISAGILLLNLYLELSVKWDLLQYCPVKETVQ